MTLLEILPERTTLAQALERVEEWQRKGFGKAALDLQNCAIFEG